MLPCGIACGNVLCFSTKVIILMKCRLTTYTTVHFEHFLNFRVLVSKTLSIFLRIERNLCFRDILKSPLCKHFVYFVPARSNVRIILQGATQQTTVFSKINCFVKNFFKAILHGRTIFFQKVKKHNYT